MREIFKEKEMIYPYVSLEKDIDGINNHLKSIREDRGKRYGGEIDTLRNVRECDPEESWRGAYVSLVECSNRLKNMFMTPTYQQDIHQFENATDDLINYAYYIKILGRQKRLNSPLPCETGNCK